MHQQQQEEQQQEQQQQQQEKVTPWSKAGAEEISDCDYFDTVDLTFSQRFDNGSYEYAGVLIPPDQTGTYNYKIVFRGTRSSVAEHVRGCVCKFKPCIRYFCHRHRYDLSDESKCVKELSSYVVPITLSNGTEIYTEVFDQFVVQPGIRSKCDDILYVNIFCDDSCKLFEVRLSVEGLD
ncbi:hypothetical protein AWZ03_007133 [Drosophila navojoa]|uniref:Methuselah N-terminal domain-containing protein n=1 Tax=Drosophila navojoa TaxID=7232 RepID=A0A484BCA3_DRONA|nr:hypothetical protein AWZ03_007133 [Drosophila navojoa]